MDIDELWEGMNEGAARKDARSLMASLNRKPKPKPKKKTKPKPKSRLPGGLGKPPVADVMADTEVEGALVMSGAGAAAVHPLAAFATVDDVLVAHQRDVNCLTDDVVATRRGGLQRLHDLVCSEAPLTAAAESLLRQLYPVVMKPLLKRFADPVERCRELAVLTTTAFARHLMDFSSALPYVVPVLMERSAAPMSYDFEQHEFIKDMDAYDAKRRGRVVDESPYVLKVTEPAEELRLLLCRLLRTVVDRAIAVGAEALLSPYFHNFITAGYTFALDPYPELRVEGCLLLALFVARVPHVMKHFVLGLMKAVKTGLDHRRAKVRLATLDAICALVACPDEAKRKGAGTEGLTDLTAFQDPNSVAVSAFYRDEARINYFAKLAVDGNATVREKFYDVLGFWMTTLPDRWDHESRLVPYILSGFSDPNPALRDKCFAVVQQCGVAYEKEKAEDLVDKRQYGVDGDTRVDYNRPLPPPFQGRPTVGMRLYVKGNVRRVLKPLLKELGDWVSSTREKATGLMVVAQVFLEEHITQDADELVVVLMKILGEPGEDAMWSTRLTGRFVAPVTYWPFLKPYAVGDVTTVAVASTSGESQARAVWVTSVLITESRPSLVLEYVGDIAATVASLVPTRSDQLRNRVVDAVAALACVVAAASTGFDTAPGPLDVAAVDGAAAGAGGASTGRPGGRAAPQPVPSAALRKAAVEAAASMLDATTALLSPRAVSFLYVAFVRALDGGSAACRDIAARGLYTLAACLPEVSAEAALPGTAVKDWVHDVLWMFESGRVGHEEGDESGAASCLIGALNDVTRPAPVSVLEFVRSGRWRTPYPPTLAAGRPNDPVAADGAPRNDGAAVLEEHLETMVALGVASE